MSVDRDTVKRIARLARIAEPEERLEPLASELNDILSWIEQLNEVNTDDVPLMTSAVETTLPLRQDKVTDGDCQDEVLRNAPNGSAEFFRVPKVVE